MNSLRPMEHVNHAPLRHSCQNYDDGGSKAKSKVHFFPALPSSSAEAPFTMRELERDDLWYDKGELIAFRAEARSLGRLLETKCGHCEELICCRGLELRMCPKRRMNKLKAIKAVLQVQKKLKQDHAHFNSENIIANVSMKYTKTAKDVARQTGEMDALVTCNGHASEYLNVREQLCVKRKIISEKSQVDVAYMAFKHDVVDGRVPLKRSRTSSIPSAPRMFGTRAA
mmetsp:Transcript_29121/g.35483  ORF Transcript_29121/g.35483 Transcript_29121/m.35483 type:complete len:227 (+) Transcript_29121:59-739(+)|eukprot:CAMPEP_0172499270 /NCGR_PEP_ID=MMETSP1066-20121228/124759_1 /TAXON_ID=671091 /ORGANISM="Coscinodiscus wailesii, Strain CCMP2513" /LENGTH=226 /DNA_ID=CAMNT_0013272915 /DNA_START=41 /DNA_END=721 /DNA_ORIENTATION=+